MMKAICILFVLFFSSFAIAQENLYLSYLTNGSQITLNVAKLRSNFTVEQTISKTLTSSSGVTAFMAGPQVNQLFVFYNQRQTPNGPIKIVRETLTTEPFQFVAGSTKVFALTTRNFQNLDVSAPPLNTSGLTAQQTNNAYATYSKGTNTIGIRKVASNGNLGPNFGTSPTLPGVPFATKIMQYNYEEYGIYRPNSLEESLTLASLQIGPQNIGLVTFFDRFRGVYITYASNGPDRWEALDIGWAPHFPLTEPDGITSAARVAEPVLYFAYRGVIAGNPFPRVGTFIRAITSQTFSPTGNVITIDPPKVHRNVGSIAFNMIAVSARSQVSTGAPSFLDVLFDRFNTGTNTNDIWARTVSDKTLKPAGPPRPVLRGKTGVVIYGLDLIRN